jgi:hypothetical protein
VRAAPDVACTQCVLEINLEARFARQGPPRGAGPPLARSARDLAEIHQASEKRGSGTACSIVFAGRRGGGKAFPPGLKGVDKSAT